jgi:glycosyltransferase involved in cell wall biosynthesis
MLSVLQDGARGLDASPLRLAVALDGDPGTTSASGTKFGLFIESLRNHAETEVVGVGDLTLSGPSRAFAVAAAWQPNRRRWKEHYRKNPLTFQLRSRQSRRWLATLPERPDLLLQVGSMSNPASPSGIPYALYLDFTFALTQREWPERAPMSGFEVPLWLRLESETYHGAAAIFCRSHHLARSLRDDYGVPDDKIHVVGAGVNITLPDVTTLPSRTQPRVLFIGSDFRRKGGDIVLGAWREVQRRFPNAELMMIGPVDAPLPANVETNGGRWDPMTIIHELRRASVFVMPSRCETWGDVFLEAMAYAIPCIGTSNDAMPEIIDDGRTGYIVPPDSPDIVADRICDLLLEPEKAQAFGSAGRHKVEQLYRWDSVVSEMLTILTRPSVGAHHWEMTIDDHYG